MRFAIVSDSLTSNSGFAKQTRLLAFELFKRGHEVVVIARADKEWENREISKGPIEWPTESFYDPKAIETLVKEAKPDIALFFRNAGFLQQLQSTKVFNNFKSFIWYADENEAPETSDFTKTEGFPDCSLLPISNAVAECLKPEKIAGVLLHGLDFDELPAQRDKIMLREKWSKKLGTTLRTEELLLICAERNDVRKNWDAVYAVVKEVQKKLPDNQIRLIQLTSQAKKDPYFDLDVCSRFYGIREDLIDLSNNQGKFNDSDIYELLQLSDLRISCSGAEGFGLLSLEAAALKVPQVAVKLKVLTEFLGQDNPSLVAPYRLAMYPKDNFYYSNKCYAIPDIERMSARVVEMLTQEDFCNFTVAMSFNKARSVCHFPMLVDRLFTIISGDQSSPGFYNQPNFLNDTLS